MEHPLIGRIDLSDRDQGERAFRTLGGVPDPKTLADALATAIAEHDAKLARMNRWQLSLFRLTMWWKYRKTPTTKALR